LFASDICLVWLLAVMMVCSVYACLLIVCYVYLPALDSNDTESIEEGKLFDYQGGEQGQADQGKPSKLVAYVIPVLLIA
jgi:hypothetical protein